MDYIYLFLGLHYEFKRETVIERLIYCYQTFNLTTSIIINNPR